MKRILVTGATGNVGRQVVAQLSATGCRIRALSRHPQSANLPHNVEVVRGDLAVPEALDASLEGVDAVFLVWVLPLESSSSERVSIRMITSSARVASAPRTSSARRQSVVTRQRLSHPL
jgi:nucleoside-diphosphate-sugar epimerase